MPKLAKVRREGAEHDETPGMRGAREAATARKGPPSEGDAPPVSTFPMTPAAKVALEMARGKREA